MNDSESEVLAAEVKEVVLGSGADLVGIVKAGAINALPRVWVGWTIQEHTKRAAEVMPDSESLVVIGKYLWDDMLELAIRKGDGWVYPGYLPLRDLRRAAIQHLERRGFKAVPFSSVSHKRLAQLAGFGNFGKNALIINPIYGPWIRLAIVLTDAAMRPDEPFEQDLCGDCEECVKACPVDALTPYKVDDMRCLVGVHIAGKDLERYREELGRYEPTFTTNSHLMCMEGQKACEYGKEKRH
ncbi:MAG: 4Fe-4S binding protein [Candidatus Bathyarchaeota archaeon]|nr:4Fe-4S binding protein [Candidatus Bathyarchaeota archaeon]